MLRWLKRYKEPKPVKEMADLLARLAWLETQEAEMEFTEVPPNYPIVYVRIYTYNSLSHRPSLRVRLAEGVGDNMLEALKDVMEILRKQEALNGRS